MAASSVAAEGGLAKPKLSDVDHQRRGFVWLVLAQCRPWEVGDGLWERIEPLLPVVVTARSRTRGEIVGYSNPLET